ncbi:MAG: amidohydrolase [Alphaproteobacteria bacterium]|nr:amidohydrolase [Alphaproteobacteria bacterium]
MEIRRPVLALSAILAVGGGTPALARSASGDALSAAVAKDYQANLKSLFEDLHAHPELSFRETRTAARLAKELKDMGIEVTEKVGGTGVVGVLRNGAGPTVMLRAEMDALPIEERNGLPYQSKVRQIDADGVEMPVMHACGHDVHMTALVGAARRLVADKRSWRGTVVFVFQPAEERFGGALAMLKDGLYSRFPKPDIALGIHVTSGMEPGRFRVEDRVASSSADSIDILVKGVGGHGAVPQKAIDPIVVASNIVMALQTLVSRTIDPLQPGIVTVGVIQGGTKRNVIPETVTMQLTVRADSPEVRTQLLDGIKRVAEGVARAYGVPGDRMPVVTATSEAAPSNLNDPASAAKVRDALIRAFGEGRMSQVPRPGMNAEDFAYYGAPEWGSVKTVWFRVGGSVTDDLSKAPPHHSPLFIIKPEPAVRGAVEGYVTAAKAFLGK